MKKTILFLFLFAPLLAFGQAKLGIHGGTMFSGLTNRISVLKDNTIPRLGFQFGVDAMLPVKSEKLYFQTGIEFTAYSEKYESENLKWGTQHDEQGGFDPTLPGDGGLYVTTISYDFFLEIPVGIRYYFNNSKWRIYIQPSVEFAYYLKSRNKGIYRNTDPDIPDRISVWSGKGHGILTVNYTGYLGIGIERKLNEKLEIFFQPNAEIQLLQLVENSVNGARFYAYGVKAGMSFGL